MDPQGFLTSGPDWVSWIWELTPAENRDQRESSSVHFCLLKLFSLIASRSILLFLPGNLNSFSLLTLASVLPPCNGGAYFCSIFFQASEGAEAKAEILSGPKGFGCPVLSNADDTWTSEALSGH